MTRRGRGKRELEGRRERALWATRDVFGDMRMEMGDVSLIKCAIDVGLRRAERRRTYFFLNRHLVKVPVREKKRKPTGTPILNNALKYTNNPTSLTKSIATHPTFSSLLLLPVVVPDETSQADARSTIPPSSANDSSHRGSEARSWRANMWLGLCWAANVISCGREDVDGWWSLEDARLRCGLMKGGSRGMTDGSCIKAGNS